MKIDNRNYIFPIHSIKYLLSKIDKYNSFRNKIVNKKIVSDNFPEVKTKLKKMDNYILNDVMHSEFMSSVEKNVVMNNVDNYCLLNLNEKSLPRIEKYLILGFLEKNKNEYRYVSFNENYQVGDEYLFSDPRDCDYTGHDKYRSKTYIVKDSEEDSFKRICTEAIKDLINPAVMEMLLLLTNLKLMLDYFQPKNDGSDDIPYYFKKEEYIQYLSAVMRATNGYIEPENSVELSLKPSTFNAVQHILEPITLKNFAKRMINFGFDDDLKSKIIEYQKFLSNIEIKEDDISNCKNTIEYFQNTKISPKDHEILHLTKKVLSNGSVFIFREDAKIINNCVNYVLKNKENEQKISNSSHFYVGNEKDKISTIEVKLVNAFLRVDQTYKYSDKIDYIFETRDGRKIKWKSSNAKIIDAVNLIAGNFDQLEKLMKEKHVQNKGIWFSIKCSVQDYEIYKTRNGDEFPQTLITRVSSISECFDFPKTDGVTYLNKKYTLNELKLIEIEETTSINGLKIFKHHFIDIYKKQYMLQSFDKKDKLDEIGKVYKFPMQSQKGDEIIGYYIDDLEKLDDFNDDFEPQLITELKAKKFGIKKSKK